MSKKLILTALLAMLGLAGAVSAANFTWVGNGPNLSDLWTDPNNWDIFGLPVNGAAGDVVFINAVTPPARDPNVGVPGALYREMYIANDGHLIITSGDTTNYGLLGSGAAYNSVNDGTVDVMDGGTWNMAQNLYIAHTSTAGSYGIVNIHAGGTIRTGGVLTIAGRLGGGELNIWGTYLLGGGVRWEHLPVPDMLPYTSKVVIYEGGLWQWTGDHITNTEDNWNNVPWSIANGHILSGVPGFEVVAAFDETNNWTDITIQRYFRAYDPTYTPALINNSANTDTVDMSTASGTIDLAWTQPAPSDPLQAVTNTVYFGTDNPPTAALTLANNTDSSIAGVAIDKLNTYYWQVDSTDPNTTVTTPGDVWTFNTNNVAPIASAESTPQRIWLVEGAASITLHATSTDDGYPLPSPTYTYTWSQVDANDILAGPTSTQDVTLNFTDAVGTLPQTRNFQVVCTDGETEGPAYAVSVIVYANPCLAGQGATGVTVGDLNSNCVVDFIDFALLANTWNVCKNYDGLCP